MSVLVVNITQHKTMMLRPELVKRIRDYFNLNIYETKVWLALVSKGIASAGEIAEISGVPRSRTYDVLESLEKEGFALAKLGKPTKYIAVKPLAVLEKLKTSLSLKTDEKMKVLESLKDTKEYAELEALHNSSMGQVKKEDISGSLKGKANIFGQLKELIENAEKEAIICMPALELLDKSRLFSTVFERLKKANISTKVYLSGNEEDIRKTAERFNIKPIKITLNSKFFIIDRKQALFYLTDTKKDDEELAVWLNSEFFSSTLGDLFDLSRRN